MSTFAYCSPLPWLLLIASLVDFPPWLWQLFLDGIINNHVLHNDSWCLNLATKSEKVTQEYGTYCCSFLWLSVSIVALPVLILSSSQQLGLWSLYWYLSSHFNVAHRVSLLAAPISLWCTTFFILLSPNLLLLWLASPPGLDNNTLDMSTWGQQLLQWWVDMQEPLYPQS
jgi:hypothetical protein